MQQAASSYHSAEARGLGQILSLLVGAGLSQKWRPNAPTLSGWNAPLGDLQLPFQWHRCVRITNSLGWFLREMRQRTELIGSFEQPVQ